jgi:hypothetical protein
MNKAKLIPVAYEWHNLDTGHCYVDYIPHENMDEKDGYTKYPLIKISDAYKLCEFMADEELKSRVMRGSRR